MSLNTFKTFMIAVYMCHDLVIPDTVYLNSFEPLTILSNAALTDLFKKIYAHIADCDLRIDS